MMDSKAYEAAYLANQQRWEERRFYVYRLRNSITDAVFYIGKGTGYRTKNHENEAKRGVQSPKCDVIRQILADGGEVIREIITSGLTSYEALTLEAKIIEENGIENLTNRVIDSFPDEQQITFFAHVRGQGHEIKPVEDSKLDLMEAQGGMGEGWLQVVFSQE